MSRGRSTMAASGRRAMNLTAVPGILQRFEEAGMCVLVLSPSKSPDMRSYRISSPTGGTLDFWPTTHSWMSPMQMSIKGVGADSLLEAIAGAPPLRRSPIVRESAKTNPQVERWVTIFTDGSYSSNRGRAAGVAAKIITSERTYDFSAMLSYRALGSVHVEMSACAFGIHKADDLRLLEPGVGIMLQSDCASALGILLAAVPGALDRPHKDGIPVVPAKRIRRELIEADSCKVIQETLSRTGAILMVRHVRGHTSKADGRHQSNRSVDRMARDAMMRRAEHVRREKDARTSPVRSG